MSKKILFKLEYFWDFYLCWWFVGASKHGRHITFLESKYGKEFTWEKLK